MKNIVILLFLFNHSVFLSQKIDTIRFVNTLKEEKYSRFFEYRKKILGDSMFNIEGLFSGETLNKSNTTNLFKIKNNKWYFRKGKKWFIFFDNGKSVKSTILINGDKYLLIWKKLNVSNENIYELKLHPIGFRISHISSYLFTPKDGIIAICGQDIFLVREDKKYLLSSSIK